MNADFQSDKTLESYLGFLIDHDLQYIFADQPINRCLEENKSSFSRQNTKDAKNINYLTPNLRLASSQSAIANAPAISQNVLEELKNIATFDAFYEYLEKNLQNALKAETGNKIVYGYGNANPDILVITDLPSEEDSTQKQILSGASGQIMHKALKAASVNEMCYICPCLFWRPLGGRKLDTKDLAQNAPLLETIIRLAAPKAIFLLGSVAANLVLNVDQTLTRLRGRVIEHTMKSSHITLPVMVSFSPTFLLQQSAAKALFWQDLLAITDSLRKID